MCGGGEGAGKRAPGNLTGASGSKKKNTMTGKMRSEDSEDGEERGG